MITGYTLWGSDKPVFRLLSFGGGRPRKMEKLAGKFTFVNASEYVATTSDMRDYLAAGDVLSPNLKRGEKIYFVNTVDSSTQVTLTASIEAGDAVAGVNGYTDVSIIELPHTHHTEFMFQAARKDGQNITKLLKDGTIRTRSEGFRTRVIFHWEMMTRIEFAKLCRVISHQVDGKIEIKPHGDVRMVWEMYPDAGFNPSFPNEKLVATNVSIGFTGVKLIKTIPRVSNATQMGPMIY
jgi:hypothetical protein